MASVTEDSAPKVLRKTKVIKKKTHFEGDGVLSCDIFKVIVSAISSVFQGEF